MAWHWFLWQQNHCLNLLFAICSKGYCLLLCRVHVQENAHHVRPSKWHSPLVLLLLQLRLSKKNKKIQSKTKVLWFCCASLHFFYFHSFLYHREKRKNWPHFVNQPRTARRLKMHDYEILQYEKTMKMKFQNVFFYKIWVTIGLSKSPLQLYPILLSTTQFSSITINKHVLCEEILNIESLPYEI